VSGGIERAMIYQYTIFVVVAIFVYLIFTEPNASLYIDLQVQGAWINIRRLLFLARMYPRIKFDTWMIKRRYKKIMRDNEQ
tara:strand:- start:1251 stop:1493 length:243 start_codon:yes stop_codon:yes gene_type:complete